MVLRAYCDDSGAHPNQQALVLGGYMATAEAWAGFSDEWFKCLRMEPGIQYFKMAEAMAFSGEFAGWTERLRNERLIILHQVIEQHARCFANSIVPFAEFNRALSAVPMKLPFRPYAAAFMGLMGAVRLYGEQIGITERVDFVFDDQVMEKKILLDNWDYAAANIPEPERALVSKTPNFANDQDALPLQAADMLAWLQRNQWEAQNGLAQPFIPPWKVQREVEGITFLYNEASIRKVLETAYKMAKAEVGE